MQPKCGTTVATHKRLTSLSERIERSSALIRTRADIVREEQNQKLLEKLNDGQRMQLRMQQTVEGLHQQVDVPGVRRRGPERPVARGDDFSRHLGDVLKRRGDAPLQVSEKVERDD